MSEEQDRANASAVIAKCQKCDRVVFASVCPLDAESRREVGKMAAEGLTVLTMRIGDVRSAPWGCECKQEEAPLPLFAEALP